MSKITYLLFLGTFLAVGALTYNIYQPSNIVEKKINVPVVDKIKEAVWNDVKRSCVLPLMAQYKFDFKHWSIYVMCSIHFLEYVSIDFSESD